MEGAATSSLPEARLELGMQARLLFQANAAWLYSPSGGLWSWENIMGLAAELSERFFLDSVLGESLPSRRLRPVPRTFLPAAMLARSPGVPHGLRANSPRGTDRRYLCPRQQQQFLGQAWNP